MKTRPMIAGAALALCLALPAQADLTSDLMAYWTFDACNGVDDTGRDHDMSLFGTPPDACVDGPKGKRAAFPFNGTNNYFVTTTSADFSVRRTSPIQPGSTRRATTASSCASSSAGRRTSSST